MHVWAACGSWGVLAFTCGWHFVKITHVWVGGDVKVFDFVLEGPGFNHRVVSYALRKTG